MFFDEERIQHIREMILARNLEDREIALEKLKPYQRDDFEKIFEVLQYRPITIRLLDPPLHEFLPREEEDIEILAKELNVDKEEIKTIINDLNEVNPMLGHRGVRLAITYPEIYAMQCRAIFEGSVNFFKKTGIIPKVEIMVPLVGLVKEFVIVKEMIKSIATEILNTNGLENMEYKIGTMIEIPRAAVNAGVIANEAEFFSFGTNDLTQMTLGFSRDDSGKFIGAYR